MDHFLLKRRSLLVSASYCKYWGIFFRDPVKTQRAQETVEHVPSGAPIIYHKSGIRRFVSFKWIVIRLTETICYRIHSNWNTTFLNELLCNLCAIYFSLCYLLQHLIFYICAYPNNTIGDVISAHILKLYTTTSLSCPSTYQPPVRKRIIRTDVELRLFH